MKKVIENKRFGGFYNIGNLTKIFERLGFERTYTDKTKAFACFYNRLQNIQALVIVESSGITDGLMVDIPLYGGRREIVDRMYNLILEAERDYNENRKNDRECRQKREIEADFTN